MTFGGEASIVEQGDRDLVGVLYHVVVGDDVAVLGIDDDAGARALKLPLAGFRIRRDVEEAAEEWVVQQRIALPGLSP